MKSNYFKIISHNSLARNVLVVASGTAGAQIIALFLMPLITRLYGPEGYGKLGIFMTIITILTPISTMAFPVAIILPEKDSESRKLTSISLFIALVFCIIISSVFLFGKKYLELFPSIQSLGNLIWFIPLVILLTSYQSVYTQWIIRKKDFSSLTKVAIAHSAVNYGTQAIIGLKYPFTYVLISVHSIAIFLRVSMLIYFSRKIKKPSSTDTSDIEPTTLQILKRYRDFPLYRAPEMLLSAISQGMPIMLLSSYFGLTSAGFYSLTRMILAVPVTLLGSSIESVFYPHFNEAFLSKSKTKNILTKPTLTLFYIGLVPFIITVIFAPFAFSIIFGQEWYEAGRYAQWLSLWFLFTLVSRPSIAAIPVFKLQRWLLIFEILSTILKAIALFSGYYFFKDPILSIALFSIVGTISYIILVLKVFRQSNISDEGLA